MSNESDKPINPKQPPLPVQPTPETAETPGDTPQGVPPIGSPIEPITKKTFVVGTLHYTMGGLALVFFWLLFGDFAMSMRDRSVSPTIQLFLKTIQVSDRTMALLISSLPQFLGMILVPIVSYKSDRYRSRWGRRIPFLMIPTPIAALAMIGIAYTPHIGTWLYATWTGTAYHVGELSTSPAHDTIVGVFAVFWTLFEVAIIISGAVLPALINDVVPRQFLGRFYGMFRAISLIDGMIFNYVLLQYAESHFTAIFTGIGILFGVGFMLMCFNVKEGQYPPPDLSSEEARVSGFFANAILAIRRFFAAVALYFKECFSKPHYLWIFGAFTLGAITFNPINLFSILYAKQLNMYMKLYGTLIAASYFVSLCLALPLGYLVDRFHALRVAMVPLFLYAVSCIYGAFFITDAKSFGVALVAHTVLSGSYFTAAASLGQALLPRSKFSTYASAGGLITALVTMIIGPVMGQILDLTHHQYRLTFFAGLVLASMTLCVLFVVYRRFVNLGGPVGYVAPGDTFEAQPRQTGFDVATKH